MEGAPRSLLAAADGGSEPPTEADLPSCENDQATPPYHLRYPAGWFVHPPDHEHDIQPCSLFAREPFQYVIAEDPEATDPWSIRVSVLHGCYPYERAPRRARSALIDGYPAVAEDLEYYYHWRLELLDGRGCDGDVTASVSTNQRSDGDFAANKRVADLIATSLDFLTDEDSSCDGVDQPPPAASDTVLVFFTCGRNPMAPVAAVIRPADGDAVTDRLTAALEGLLAGPTDQEAAAGFRSWFSYETAGGLNGVQVDDGGHAIVDFADFSALIPNASTTAGRRLLLAELRSTIFQFDDVVTAELWFDGSCHAFWAWLRATCAPLIREDG